MPKAKERNLTTMVFGKILVILVVRFPDHSKLAGVSDAYDNEDECDNRRPWHKNLLSRKGCVLGLSMQVFCPSSNVFETAPLGFLDVRSFTGGEREGRGSHG